MKEFLITQLLNATVLKPYGKMLNLSIDSKTKTLTCTILPKGEQEPIRIEIPRYDIEKRGEKTVLVIQEVKVSREWMDTLAAQFFAGKKIPLEGALASIVPLIL